MLEATLSGKEARAVLRQYKRVFKDLISNNNNFNVLFSKIVINSEMYKELIVDITIPKGHVVTFEGLPVQPSNDLPYGSIIFLPKFMTVEIGTEKKEKIN